VATPLVLKKLLIKSRVARWLPAVRRLTDGAGPFLHYYSDRVLSAPFPEIRDAARLLDRNAADAIDLGTGDTRFDIVPSESTKLPADRRGWPPAGGLGELRQAVAAKLLADQKLELNPSNEVLITHGAAGAFGLALDAFVNPGQAVVLFEPASPLFHLGLRQRRVRVRSIVTTMENGFIRFQLPEFIQAVRGARIIVLNQPSNPTGGIFAREDLEQIAWWANRRDVLILNDETFERFQYEGERTCIGTIAAAANRTVTIGSVSKGYALASARVGWLAGHRHLVEPCLLTSSGQAPFVPTICQQIALAALRTPAAGFEAIRAEFASRRRYAYERLKGLGLEPAWPAGGFFLWLPIGGLGLTGRDFAAELWRSKRVIVWPGSLFGDCGSGHVRLSYALDDGRLREGIGRIGEFVQERALSPSSEKVPENSSPHTPCAGARHTECADYSSVGLLRAWRAPRRSAG
jgi:aspartate/methionine/tyrosine aminotransferase